LPVYDDLEFGLELGLPVSVKLHALRHALPQLSVLLLAAVHLIRNLGMERVSLQPPQHPLLVRVTVNEIIDMNFIIASRRWRPIVVGEFAS
jgi:hypothetical protein